MQAHVQSGCVLLPIIVTQDEATLDHNGRKSLTPVYATFGNIRAQYRNEPWARVLVAYLPKANKSQKKGLGKELWKREKRRTTIEAKLRPLLTAGDSASVLQAAFQLRLVPFLQFLLSKRSHNEPLSAAHLRRPCRGDAGVHAPRGARMVLVPPAAA